MATHEDIASKAEWEGGLDEALEWFQDNEVPADLHRLWGSARSQKDDLENTLQAIVAVLESHGHVL